MLTGMFTGRLLTVPATVAAIGPAMAAAAIAPATAAAIAPVEAAIAPAEAVIAPAAAMAAVVTPRRWRSSRRRRPPSLKPIRRDSAERPTSLIVAPSALAL